ncbi:MAG: hypothetical protein U1F08_09640 [Steroidobacteraceae bacterium]
MPYRLTWESGPTGVVAEYSDRLSRNDLADYSRELTVDPRWHNLRYVIVDASRIDGVDVDTSTPLALAAPYILLIGAACTRDPLPYAVVTSNPELMHLLERQRAFGVFPYPTPVFETVAAARRWVAQQLPANNASGREDRRPGGRPDGYDAGEGPSDLS